jgi:hypothetical protein
MFNMINAIRTRLRGPVVALLCAGLVGFAFAPAAAADEWDKKTVVTVSAPVEIPGKVLPAGTYVFKLLNSASDRNIVQIFDRDEKRLYATVLAIPDYRLQPTGDTVIRFEERPTGAPEAIKAWFYPGDVYGQEFVYPHKRAVELAKQNNQNVLSMLNETMPNVTAQADSASQPSVQEMQKTEVTAVKPSGEHVELAQAVSSKPDSSKETSASKSEPKTEPVPPAATSPVQSASHKPLPHRLPKTASEVPLISLVGAGSLGSALLARFSRRRAA